MLNKIVPLQDVSPSNHHGDRLEVFTVTGGGMDGEKVGRCGAGIWHVKAEWEGTEAWPKLMGKGYCRALDKALVNYLTSEVVCSGESPAL